MKKHKFLFLVIASFLLWGTSCSQDNYLADGSKTDPETRASEEIHLCTFDFVNADLLEQWDNLSTRAVLERNLKWEPGDVIRIKFLNGDDFLQNKVKQFANEWTKYASIKFVYVPVTELADVKIGFQFNGDNGSWSYLGTLCRNSSQDKPTINFGWFSSSTTDTEFSRTVTHEFGHVLGLQHEHQHPENAIQWNKPVVYAAYAKQGWTEKMVDNSLFARLDATSTNYSAYDPMSIMGYWISADYTLDGYSVETSTVLSDMDKQFIAEQYPPVTKPECNLPSIQEAWIDAGFMEWRTKENSAGEWSEGMLALKLTELGAKQTTLPDVCNGEQLNSVKKMFSNSSLVKAPMFNSSKITDFSEMFLNSSSLTTIPLLDTSKGSNFGNMFRGCTSLTSIPLLDTSNGRSFYYMFGGCTSLTTIPQLNTSNVSDFGYMFKNCSSLTTIPLLDTSKGTSFFDMFENCSSLTTIPQLNTSNSTNFALMFLGCSSLTTIPSLDTSKGLFFNSMFNGCTSLTSIPQLNTSKGTNFSYMFFNCKTLTSIPLLNTSSGTDFGQMFNGCSSLKTVPLLDTSKGTMFYAMFANCSSLTTIPQLDTSSGTSFSYMFLYCKALTSIPLLKTSNGTDFSVMFTGCVSLTNVAPLDTSKGTNFRSMFSSCSSLKSIPPLNTSNGTDFSAMFGYCASLTSIPTIDTHNGTNFESMFYVCRSLVEKPQLDLSKATNTTNMLYGTPFG